MIAIDSGRHSDLLGKQPSEMRLIGEAVEEADLGEAGLPLVAELLCRKLQPDIQDHVAERCLPLFQASLERPPAGCQQVCQTIDRPAAAGIICNKTAQIFKYTF